MKKRLNEIVNKCKNNDCAINLTDINDCVRSILKTLDIKLDLPIDIYKIAEKMKVNIIVQFINEVDGIVIKRTNVFTGEKEQMILINDKLNKEEQRYAIGYGLAFILINENSTVEHSYHSVSMNYVNVEDILCNYIAILLFMPVEILKKESEIYMRNNFKQIIFSKWMLYLHALLQIPYEKVVLGYHLCCILTK